MLDQREVTVARVRPPHRLEDARRSRLERQVHVLADRSTLGNRGDNRLPEVLRVRAREANSLDPLDRVASSEQLTELGLDPGSQVAAPGVDVLAEQRELLDPLSCEPCDLGHDLTRSAADLAAAHGRDDAVGAL